MACGYLIPREELSSLKIVYVVVYGLSSCPQLADIEEEEEEERLIGKINVHYA